MVDYRKLLGQSRPCGNVRLGREAAVRSGGPVTTSHMAWGAASTDSSARCRDCVGVLSRAIDQNDFAGAAAHRSGQVEAQPTLPVPSIPIFIDFVVTALTETIGGPFRECQVRRTNPIKPSRDAVDGCAMRMAAPNKCISGHERPFSTNKLSVPP